MRIQVRVKPNAKRPKVERLSDKEYLVAVAAPPTEGKANGAVIEALADHFGIRQSAITIVHGQKGRQKLIEIDND